MPRKPSASALQLGAPVNSPSSSQLLVHRPTESHHAPFATAAIGVLHPSMQSLATSGPAATPQQKVVQVLVNRLKNKLPCHSGLSLARVETNLSMRQTIETLVELSRDSLDMIVWALTELLDRLAKQTDSRTGHLAIEVLQSQLFILKVLSIVMASRWSRDPSTKEDEPSSDLSPSDSTDQRNTASIYSSDSSWQEPPPLDDSCVKYILSVMVLFMRQTSLPEAPLVLQTQLTESAFRHLQEEIEISPEPPEEPRNTPGEIPLRNQPSSSSIKSEGVHVRSSIPIAATNTNYEKSHLSFVKSSLSVNSLIAKFVGRIIFHISASNWSVVHERLSNKISHLAAHPDAPPDTVDLQLMAHSVMDRVRLVGLLNQLSSLLVNMRKESQHAVAVHLRSAVWNWIDVFPAEFNEAIRTRGKMEGAPERVYDLLISNMSSGNERIYWPALSILLCCTSDKIKTEFVHVVSSSKVRKELRFGDTVLRHLCSNNGKLAEVALACAVDVCRAAAYINPALGETTLRELATDVAHEIKGSMYYSSGSRPQFWDSYDDIDVALFADALSAIYRFLPLEDSTPLFQVCMNPEHSDAVKACAVRAGLTQIHEATRFKWQKSARELSIIINPRCRDILKVVGIRRLDIDQNNQAKRVAYRPKAKRIHAEPLSDRELLVLSILMMWREEPESFMIGLNNIEDHLNWTNVAVKLWEAPVDICVKVSIAGAMHAVTGQTFATPPTDPKYNLMVDIVKLSLPVTLLSIVGNLLSTRTDVETQRLWIDVASGILEIYAMETDIPTITIAQKERSRLSALLLSEVSFLVALTSSDSGTSELAAKGLRLISHAERQRDVPINPFISDEDRSKRNPVYEQLGDPRITVAGRLNSQRRIRKLIRMLSFSAGIQAIVWQECYTRWRVLHSTIYSNDSSNPTETQDTGHVNLTVQQDTRFQWQNLTLYLAALSGSCISDALETFALEKIIPIEMVPDKLRVIEKPRNYVFSFLDSLIEHLLDTDPTIREALGSEISPRLYGELIPRLQVQVVKLDGQDRETTTAMLDQIISIVKLMSENSQVALEDVVNVNVGPIMIELAKRVSRCSGVSSQRLKIKFCSLCENFSSRTDDIALRNDSAARHEVLDYILQWMSPVKSSRANSVSAPDLNLSCLRAIVKLLERLELKTSDQGDEAVNTVSRLFNKYSTALLGSIEICQPDTLVSDYAQSDKKPFTDIVQTTGNAAESDSIHRKSAELQNLVITGLTHLVGANSESGFKQCLQLAYDRDNRKRTIFAHVFARVIGQGTIFESKDKTILKARFQALCELVRGSDLMIPMIICEICPPNDVDTMISVLLNIFNNRGSLLSLMKLVIEREISGTDTELNLFRGNSTYIRFLSAFTKIHGYNYLRSLVKPLVDTMSTMPPGTSYEIDPTKAIGQDIVQNKRNVEYVASKFLKIMSSSLPVLPGMFREICAHIAKVVSEVWPESKYAAMGAFIFLRFISPAVVHPEIIDIEVPKNENTAFVRRGLMVVAKIIQNLANNLFFGREPFMVTLNKFLESNITNVTRFLSELHKYPGRPDDINDNWTGTTSDETDVIILHRFFHKHADQIGKELLSHSHPIFDGNGSAVSGKQAWDNFCALLVDLGPPLEAPRLSGLNSSENREYLEFMSKYSNRNTGPVENLFMETNIREDTAVFVLRLSSIDVESLDIELFMYHIFKMLTSSSYRSCSFDIILDCTSFTSNSEVPLQWLKYCAELIPMDIRTRFEVARILNPNTLTQKFMRRLYNISAGTPICNEIKVYTSVLQLMEDVRTAALPPLGYPVSLEQELHENFNDVTMRTAARIPVILRVGTSHIRVTSIKSLPVSPGLSCQSTELIPLTDVSDIYNVSTGHDLHEFIIRRRQGVTVYFSSPSREKIVKTIRSAKGQLKEAQAPLAERFSSFSNVPATLLHIGFLSVDLSDEELRGAAFELLAAVCDYLKYDKNPIVAPSAGFIPGDPISFVAKLSENLAEFAPQLTLDFIHEVSAAMTSMEMSAISHRISCLSYVSPWIQNLSHFANPTHTLYERSGARLRDCIRTLADLSISFPEITSTIQKEIWSEVAKLDADTIDIVLDELVRTATDGGIGTRCCEAISHIIATLSSINVRGRIYSKLRKALSKVPPKFTNVLVEHQNWNEISTLIRLTLVVGSQSTQPGQTYVFVPEVVHLVSLIAGEGPTLVRKSVYGTIMNLLQSLYTSRPDDNTETELKQLIDDCMLPETLKLFGLQREKPTSEYTTFDLSKLEVTYEKNVLDTHERLVQLLIRLLEVSAGTRGQLNVWRARWMSLVTATAFQQSPAVQTRSFVVLAALAVQDVDDDFLYQILVAFRNVLGKADETNTMVIVSMLRCLCKVVPAVVGTSRYICLLFWLAVALLQVSHLGFYVEATWLLKVTLENMEHHGLFKTNSVETVLLEARDHIDDVMSQLDDMLRISFIRSFSFSLASIIFKGMRHSTQKESAEVVLRTLLRVTSRAYCDSPHGAKRSPCSEAMGYFIALLPASTTRKTFRKLLSDANVEQQPFTGVPDSAEAEKSTPVIDASILGIEDPQLALLTASFIGTMLATAQGDDAETEMLYSLLSTLAKSYPDTITMIYDSLQDRIKETFANSSNSKIIRSASSIFRTSLQDPNRFNFASNHGSDSTLNTLEGSSIGPSRSHLEALERLDMQGLANNFQFLPSNRGHATKVINWIPGLVELMINS